MNTTSIRILITSEDGDVLDVIDGIDTDDMRDEIKRFPGGILASAGRSVDSYFPEENDDEA